MGGPRKQPEFVLTPCQSRALHTTVVFPAPLISLFQRGTIRNSSVCGKTHVDAEPPFCHTDALLSVGYRSGQPGQTVNLLAYAFLGSNPSPTTILHGFPIGGRAFLFHMFRHYITPETLRHDTVELEGEDARHLQNVLRAEPGTRVEGFDGAGHTRLLRVAETGKKKLRLVAGGEVVPHAEPSVKTTLYVGACKGARMDWLVEKAAELGAWRIVAVECSRSVARELGGNRLDRWRRIAREGLRQCGGVWETTVDAIAFQTMAAELATHGAAWWGAIDATAPTLYSALVARGAPLPPTCAWCVGPEGDFTPDEMAALAATGAQGVRLGGRVLRTETAALYGLCALNLLTGKTDA